jgi:8-oxo-dGTP diphosphatase
MISGQRIAVRVDLAPDNESVAEVHTIEWVATD